MFRACLNYELVFSWPPFMPEDPVKSVCLSDRSKVLNSKRFKGYSAATALFEATDKVGYYRLVLL